MRSANREYFNNQFLTTEPENFPSSITLPSSTSEIKQQDEIQLPPLDLNKVTGKKILFESSDSEQDDETTSEPQVPVSFSISEPCAVPDGFNQNQPHPLPIPSSSSSSATLDAIKTRVTNLIKPSNSLSSQINESTTIIEVEDDDNDDQPIVHSERNQAISAKFNRKRRKGKRNKNKKKNNHVQMLQQTTNENELMIVNEEEARKRYIARELQYSFLKKSNPILRALTAEAHKKLGISQEEVNGKYDLFFFFLVLYSLSV